MLRRRLFTLLSAASLLLCVGTCVLWARSYSGVDAVGGEAWAAADGAVEDVVYGAWAAEGRAALYVVHQVRPRYDERVGGVVDRVGTGRRWWHERRSVRNGMIREARWFWLWYRGPCTKISWLTNFVAVPSGFSLHPTSLGPLSTPTIWHLLCKAGTG